MSASSSIPAAAATRGRTAALVGLAAIVVAVVLAALVVGGVGAGTVGGVVLLGGISGVAVIGAIASFVALARGTSDPLRGAAAQRRRRIALCIGNVVALLSLAPLAWGVLVLLHGA